MQTNVRVWIQPSKSVEDVPLGIWKRHGIRVVKEYPFNIDGIDLLVEGDGSDVERLVEERKDIFNSWDYQTKFRLYFRPGVTLTADALSDIWQRHNIRVLEQKLVDDFVEIMVRGNGSLVEHVVHEQANIFSSSERVST